MNLMFIKSNCLKQLLLLAFFSVLLSDDIKANHGAGGDITYTCVGPNRYQFTLKLFRDCSGFDMLLRAPMIVRNSCGYGNPELILYLQDPSTGVNCTGTIGSDCANEISQLCPPELPYSTCKGGSLPGMEEFTYVGTVTFSGACDTWSIDYNLSARNYTINLVQAPFVPNFHIQTTMNTRSEPCNNSPIFINSHPIPYICVNQLINYNFGVVETDGDSLVFSLVSALQNVGANVFYNPGYSATAPIPGITINPHTGQLTFTPTILGNFVVAVKVSEYRNGVLIGTVIRDIQFVVQDCDNHIPDADAGQISNLTGTAVQTGPYTLEMCEGNTFTFDAIYTDLDVNDTLTLTTNITSVLPGATVITSGTNPLTATFSWTTTAGSTGGNNSFIVTIEDNACPVTGVQFFNYEIKVINGSIAGPDKTMTICGNQQAQITATGGAVFYWFDMEGDTIVPSPEFSCNPCYNPFAQPDTTTSYVVVSDLNGTCVNRDTVTVAVVPDFTYTITQSGTFSCREDPIHFNIIPNPPGDYTFSWSPSVYLNRTDIANPTGTYPSPGTFTYYIDISSPNSCLKTDSVSVTVLQNYPPVVTAVADNRCSTDSIQLNVIFADIIPVNCGPSITPCTSTFPITIGAGNVSTSFPTPFSGSRHDGRIQMLYRASEINAMGFAGGRISALAFNIITKLSAQAYSNFSIKIGCTDLTALPAGFQTGLSTVYTSDSVNTTTGWNNFVLSTTYDWDGVSNLIIEVCFDNTTGTNNDIVGKTNTAFNSVLHAFINNASGCALSAPLSSTSRPNIRFGTCGGAPNPADYNYHWSPGATLSDSTIQNPGALPSGQITYTVTVTHIIGGCSDTSTINIQFGDQYDASITPAGPFCVAGNAITLIAADEGGVWAGTGIVNTTAGIFNPGTAGAGLHPVIYSIPGICGDADTIVITVIASPDATITPAGPFCPASPAIALTAADDGGHWSGAGITDSVNGIFNPSIGIGIYTVTYTISAAGCINTDTIAIEVNSLKADFGYKEIPCTSQIQFINLSTDTLSSFWNFGDGTTSNENRPLHSFQTKEKYTVILITNPGSACADTAQKVIPFENDALSDTLFIPNVFTPNGDGKNDYFEIKGIDNPCMEFYRLIIFNRWGLKVFEAVGSQFRWDGGNNGNALIDGIYFYVLEGNSFKRSGSVILLR